MRLALVACAVSLLLAPDATAERPDLDLASMSLEQLMEVQVTLAARKAEPLYEAAAAVSVLTADDLRRSGATSIAEALRLVPGMVVAHVDANKWAISARGFNGRFGNKLLVQIDGRTVYTPTFSGVYWDVQDLVLEDVERIEVIRGPGATLWGANAVNGVVSVVTRSAAETRGPLLTASAGTHERSGLSLRFGGEGPGGLAWRAYGKWLDRDGFVDAGGRPTADDWRLGRGGFRLDRDGADAWMLQGDVYDGHAGQTFRLASLQPPYRRLIDDDTRIHGASLLGRWRRQRPSGDTWTAQVFWDRFDRADVAIDEVRDTWDIDVQRRMGTFGRHDVVWGLGYRFTTNMTRGSFSASLDPPGRSEDVLSAFVQDDVELAGGRAQLTAGTKLEHNDHTGFEVQPSLRLWWEVRQRHAVWSAVSRALRVPSQADEDVRLNLLTTPADSARGVPLTLFSGFGQRSVKAEALTAFEAGYRSRPADDLVVDAAAFFNVYRGLRGGRLGAFFTEQHPQPAHLVLPFYTINGVDGQTWGLELSADWRLAGGRWRLRPAYAFLEMRLRAVNGADAVVEDAAGESPEHQASLWSSADLGRGWSVDGVLRYVDELPTHDFDRYLVADARLGWQATPRLELEAVARNLLDRRHPEFRAFFIDTLPTQTETEVYLRARWSVSP